MGYVDFFLPDSEENLFQKHIQFNGTKSGIATIKSNPFELSNLSLHYRLSYPIEDKDPQTQLLLKKLSSYKCNERSSETYKIQVVNLFNMKTS